MKLAIMQPYFFPYIGYFQLIQSADKFIVYDNIKYTKKGWINRNRFLQNGKDVLFSIPLKKDSDYLDVRERKVSPAFNRVKLLNQLKQSYGRAPAFNGAFPVVEKIIMNDEVNLFDYIHYSIVEVCSYLGIDTEIVKSSNIHVDHSLQSQGKVIALCQAVGATTYINAIGGQELYTRNDFSACGIDLKFIQSKPFEYKQLKNYFIPWLSIIDVLMFNSVDEIKTCIATNYELV